jgi:hypothetical protein
MMHGRHWSEHVLILQWFNYGHNCSFGFHGACLTCMDCADHAVNTLVLLMGARGGGGFCKLLLRGALGEICER